MDTCPYTLDPTTECTTPGVTLQAHCTSGDYDVPVQVNQVRHTMEKAMHVWRQETFGN